MPIPDYQTLMAPVLKLAADREVSVPEAEVEMAKQFGLTDAEREALLPSGKQHVLANRIHWARFHMGKAGLIVAQPRRGRFVASEAGRAFLAANPRSIDTRLLMTIPGYRDFILATRSGQGDGGSSPPPQEAQESRSTPEETIEAAFETQAAALRAELLERILASSPEFFERLIVELLLAMGYGGSRADAARHLGKSGDGGVDGVIDEDALGLDQVYMQAKRYMADSTIGRPQIQAFVGSLVGMAASKGVFVTTSSFSREAREFAARIPQRVILIDGARLTELMIRYSVGVRVHRVVEFKRVDEDFFSGE